LRRAIDGADSGALAEQSAPGQIEVALGQPVQVQLGQQLAHFVRAALERRQESALKPLAQPTHPRAPQQDRPVGQAQPAGLAEAIAIPGRRVDGGAPLIPPSGEQAVDLFFQHPLQESLHALSGERLPGLPRRA
jgi:hypothetical protein